MSHLTGRIVAVTGGLGAPYGGVFLEFASYAPPARTVALVENAGGVVGAVDLGNFNFIGDPPPPPVDEGPFDVIQFQVVHCGPTSLLFVVTRNGHMYVAQRKNKDISGDEMSENHVWRQIYAPVI